MTYDEWYQQNYADSPVSHADYTFGEEVWKAAQTAASVESIPQSPTLTAMKAAAKTDYRQCLMPFGSKTCHHCKKPVHANTPPPTSAAMRAAAQGEAENAAHRIAHLLDSKTPLSIGGPLVAEITQIIKTAINTVASLADLPVSEQGSDSYKGIPRCIGCGRLLSPHCEDCQPHPATTPPPASERCVRCGCGKVASNASLSELLTDCECDCHRGVESSTLPAPSVSAGEKDDGWVTFGTIKTDIENETQTFERVPTVPAPSSGDAAERLVEAWENSYAQGFNQAICDQRQHDALVRCINALITTERETTRTAIVGLVRKRAIEVHVLGDKGAHAYATVRALADLIERTPLDELKGGEDNV